MAETTTTLSVRVDKAWANRFKRLVKDQGRGLREVLTEQLDIWIAQQTGSTALIARDEKSGKLVRPTEPTPEILTELFRKLEQTTDEGLPRTLTQVCKDPGMPSYKTLLEWAKSDSALGKEISTRLDGIRQEHAHVLTDYLIELVGKIANNQTNHQRAAAIQKIVEFLAKNMDPQKWGAAENQTLTTRSHSEVVYRLATNCPHCGRNTVLDEDGIDVIDVEAFEITDDNDIEELEA